MCLGFETLSGRKGRPYFCRYIFPPSLCAPNAVISSSFLFPGKQGRAYVGVRVCPSYQVPFALLQSVSPLPFRPRHTDSPRGLRGGGNRGEGRRRRRGLSRTRAGEDTADGEIRKQRGGFTKLGKSSLGRERRGPMNLGSP